jgi:hypothetical protein
MALSESVQTSLEEAQAALKNALAYAARQEEPFVMTEISKMIQTIDSVIKYDKAYDKLKEQLSQNGFGGIF